MRVLVAVLLVAAALAGCTAGGRGSVRSAPSPAPGAISADPAAGSDVPVDDPSAPREDDLGQTPDAAVMTLIDTLTKRDWTKAYSLYASPTPNAEMAAKDWSEANERYAEFTVRETRVADYGSAWVRVTYKVTTTPAGGSPYLVTVEEPGEWWPLRKVGGLWKVAWMPRQ